MASVTKRRWTRNGKESVSWQVSWVESGVQRKKSGFRLKSDAEAWATLKEKDLIDGVSRQAAHRITVQDASREYLDNMTRRQNQGAITAAYVSLISSYIKNYIAKPPELSSAHLPKHHQCHAPDFKGALTTKKLADVRPRHIEAFRDALIDAGLSHRTVRAVMTTLHGVFELCRRRDYVAVNPASRIPVELPREMQGARVQPPPREVLERIIDNADTRTRLMVEFAATTGLRLGEMRAIQWESIDLEKKQVKVVRSVNIKNVVGPPKSKAGRRRVPISEALAERLAAHRVLTAYKVENDLVFPNREGGFISHYQPRDALNRVASKLGLPHMRWHALRHYAVSSWIAADLNLKVVQTFAGHANVTTTANVYGHLFPDDDFSRQIDAVGSALIR